MRRGGTLREPEGEDELALGALEAEAGGEEWTSGCELLARAGLGNEACPHSRPSRERWPNRCGRPGSGRDPSEVGLRTGARRNRAGQRRRGGGGRASEGRESGGRRRSDGFGVLYGHGYGGRRTGTGDGATGWSCGIGEWSTWDRSYAREGAGKNDDGCGNGIGLPGPRGSRLKGRVAGLVNDCIGGSGWGTVARRGWGTRARTGSPRSLRQSPELGARGRGGLEGGRDSSEHGDGSNSQGSRAGRGLQDGDSSAAERLKTGILVKALEVGKWAAGYVIEH